MNSRHGLKLRWILAVLFIVYSMVSAGCNRKYVGDCQVELFCDHKSEFSRDALSEDLSRSIFTCTTGYDFRYKINYFIQFKLTYNLNGYYQSTKDVIIIPIIDGLYMSRITELNICSGELQNTPVFQEMVIIESINISHNYLIEAKLYNENPLNSLQKLDFSYNRISIFQSEGSNPYTGLTHLNVSHNLLESVPARPFQYLINLQSLDLSFNNIESLETMSFEGQSQLQKLFLTSNRISDCAFLLQRLDDLEELYLDRNEIKYLKSAEFEHLKKLKILIINSNLITSIDDNFFKNIILLETLDLKNNSLEKINKNSFENEYLESVDLSYNKIEILYRNQFKGNNISSFTIKGNKIKGNLGKGMFEGVFGITELDLSNQYITSIEDYAFYMLKELILLDISNNQIENLSKLSFKTLTKLIHLDLSHNRIVDIDFDKLDLISLKSLHIRNNMIHQLSPGVFLGLGDLLGLYLSWNNISDIAQNVFQPLQQLMTIKLDHNPLTGNIEANRFSGLHSLENLDLSYTLLNVIKNGALYNMENLKYLNVSHSNLTELGNEIFGNDTDIEILDLSHNNLNKFVTIHNIVIKLKELYLNNNVLTKITALDFDGLNNVSKFTVAHNLIEEIELHSFDMLRELQYLDLSYNPKLTFTGSLVQKNRKLETLSLSGTRNPINYMDMDSVPLLELALSSSNISDLQSVDFFQLKHLISLDLSRNTIKRIEIEVFNNITNLRFLDLSFNQIVFIQPGAFKDNTYLNTLNISHNQITTITYGTFRGMEHVDTIDLSFNNLKTLSSNQFLDIPNIKSLIVDSNKLEKIEMRNLPGLERLSLGDNLLNCEDLSKMISVSLSLIKQRRLNITTMKIDFHSANVHGITCYHKSDADMTDLSDVREYNGNSSAVIVALLSDIRNSLITDSHATSNSKLANTENSDDLNSIVNQVKNLTITMKDKVPDINKLSDVFSANTNNTNKLLSKILELLTVTAQSSTKTSADSTNTSFGNNDVISGNVKELGLKVFLLNNKVVGLEDKIAELVAHFENKTKNKNAMDIAEKLIFESGKSGVENGHTTFTEVCVVVILVILVALLLYKLYEFGIPKLMRRSRTTTSTQGITESIENSNF